MLVQHIALVPVTHGVDPSELARVGAALQKQVLRDVASLWGVSACVAAFARLEDVPIGYLPILLTPRELGWGAGVHLDDNGQPYAQVELSPYWSHAASRACLELLVNPLGERCVGAPSPRADQGLVQILVEIGAASAAPGDGYGIDGVLVSDFCTPAYFVRDAALGERAFSFHGSLSAPLSLRPGGHLTWFDLDSNSWWLRCAHADGSEDRKLGALDRPFLSVRELVGRQREGAAPPELQPELMQRVQVMHGDARRAAQARARRLRALVGISSEPEPLLLERASASPRAAEPADHAEASALQTASGDVDDAPQSDATAGAPIALARLQLVRRSMGEVEREQPEAARAALEPEAGSDELGKDELTDPAYELVADDELTPDGAKQLAAPILPPPPPVPVEARAEALGAPAPAVDAGPAPLPKPAAARAPLPARKQARKQWRPPRPSHAAESGSAASSSIAPMLAAEPKAKPGGLRDARLLGIAAAVGIGFFALVARERGDAHAASKARPAQHAAASSPKLVTPATHSPASTEADAAAAPVQTAPAAAAAPAAPSTEAVGARPDVGTQHLAASVPPAPPVRRKRERPRAPAAAAPAEPTLEELLDTRR